jgi:hypothetical protein
MHETDLDEADIGSLLAEALAADVETILQWKEWSEGGQVWQSGRHLGIPCE